jgi:hypothetical protein
MRAAVANKKLNTFLVASCGRCPESFYIQIISVLLSRLLSIQGSGKVWQLSFKLT